MWSTMFIVLTITTIIFTLLSYYMNFAFKRILLEKYGMFILVFTIIILVSTVLWFLLAAAVIEIEFPYTAIQSDDTIINGTHTWGDSTAVSLMYLFMMFAAIQIVYGLGTIPLMVIKYFKIRYMKKMEE